MYNLVIAQTLSPSPSPFPSLLSRFYSFEILNFELKPNNNQKVLNKRGLDRGEGGKASICCIISQLHNLNIFRQRERERK